MPRKPLTTIVALCLVFLAGCTGLQQYIETDATGQVLLGEAIDTAGYTLGLMAAEKPELSKITTGMLEIGKQGYLTALQNSGAV